MARREMVGEVKTGQMLQESLSARRLLGGKC